MNAITVDELHLRYPGASRDAVDGISFTVEPGEIFGFLGPNGAGKSTTQRVLTRLLRGHTGRVDVLGASVDRWGPDFYEHVGVGFELPAHYAKLTARENLAAFGSLFSGPVERPETLLSRLGLADAADRPAGAFSKGMQMRLNLARALVNRPRLLFLDEPVSGMDPVHAELVRDLVRAEAAGGTTVFLTTHDMVTAERLCDRVAFVVDGRIAALDTPGGFRRGYGRRCLRVTYRDGDAPRTKEFALSTFGEGPEFQEFLQIVHSGTVETVHTAEATLDEVFAAITGGTLPAGQVSP